MKYISIISQGYVHSTCVEQSKVSRRERLANEEARAGRVGGEDSLQVFEVLGDAIGAEIVCPALSFSLLVLI
jgi:hypothetical protein